MDKSRSRAVASRGKKGQSKGGSCSTSNPPPSERNPKKGKSKVKKNKNKKVEEEKKKEEDKEITFPPQRLSAEDDLDPGIYLSSDDSWSDFYVAPNGRRVGVSCGLMWDYTDEE